MASRFTKAENFIHCYSTWTRRLKSLYLVNYVKKMPKGRSSSAVSVASPPQWSSSSPGTKISAIQHYQATLMIKELFKLITNQHSKGNRTNSWTKHWTSRSHSAEKWHQSYLVNHLPSLITPWFILIMQSPSNFMILELEEFL